MTARTATALIAALALCLGATLTPSAAQAAPPSQPALQTPASQAPAPGHATLVNQFVAAWNSHDVNSLLTTITPDVVLRQRKAQTTPRTASVEVADVLGRRSVLSDPSRLSPDGAIVWASGWQELAEWAKDLFQDDHRLDVDGIQERGDLVRFTYRARVNPYRQIAGVEPPTGAIEATVRGGKLALLTLESGPDAVTRRDAAVTYALVDAQSRAAARWAEAHGQSAPERTLATGPDTQARALPVPARVLLPGAVALALTAALAAFRTRVTRFTPDP